ncbi:4a-hydroxytetrahydrobiopterin dehydratase [Rubrivivax gelatinosus]|uniref:4a-hydroxytetrahydrobiopterin dehydratase n=1 Tax=Rubrivivax gelatinosus TaxID=28068 RepID=UPI00190587CC|nr:4a-hydroxytetrahydrobiopterin dehydratase [Rubrivivax gelatinosus]MBK1612313.1 4a-hydroxytetrahydrobiopterin dehydratase [Rubrivivax gelatinosus]MBZ8143988.1 4a-hydroxytetrahydrobiopterin dehydratase [Rubrivivax gelatinosus]
MSTWRRKPANEPFTDDETEARLKDELPGWTLEGGWIRRKFRTSGWKGTLMVVNTVGHLAEAAWHHPDLAVSYAFVTVKLQTHDAKGITEKDFALAKKIDEVVMWQPGREAEPVFEGTPDDPRFKYIKYD